MYRNLEQWSIIRRRVLEEGISQRQAARETGIHRNTIRKMLQYKSQPSGPQAPRYPKLEPYAKIIDHLITANVSLPLDTRLSVKAIHNYLQRAGFAGSYRSVKDYVRRRAIPYYGPYCAVWDDAYELIVSLNKSDAINFMQMLSRANPPVVSSARAQKIFHEAAKCIKPRGDANSGQKRLNAQFEWIRRVIQKESVESLGEEFGNHPDFLTIVRYLYEGRLTHRNRALVILAHRHGISDRVISAALAINRHTVRRSREIFDQGGAIALFGSKPKSNRKVDDTDLATAIFGVLHEPPSNHGINRTSWTMAHLRQVLTKIGKPACPDTIRAIAKAAGYRWRKARVVLTSNDPDYSNKLGRIRSILSDLQANVTHFYSLKKNTTEMIRMMELLLERYKDKKKLYLSWDAASWHISKRLFERIEENNQIVVKSGGTIVETAPLPARAQFLNVIESIFSVWRERSFTTATIRV
jgi:transposase